MTPSLEHDQLAILRAGKLAGAKRLDLSCGLQHFPEEIYDLTESLEILNLSGNNLSALPNDLTRLTKLKVIFCSDNQFTHVPEILGQCPELSMIGFKSNQISMLASDALPSKLQWLILTDNQLDQLPASLGRCLNLQKLMLAGNKLAHLPDEMATCNKLELLRISANRFELLPEWLLSLPRLAWLAFSGNPLCNEYEAAQHANHHISKIDWFKIQLQQKLGEGASGIIYQATLQNTADNTQTVALKLFKGTVTSDGLPQSEMAACIAAGAHPNLTSTTGILSGHPDDVGGLVMSLINASFSNLGNPPSLASCTRDTYPTDKRFAIKIVLNIALGIAKAIQHLHTKGITHGDCYAHNILHNDDGDCLLVDFGAASFLPVKHAKTLQRIEVLAYARLLEELIERCDVSEQSKLPLQVMRNLQHTCEQTEVANRPGFTEITQALIAIQSQASYHSITFKPKSQN